MWGMQLIERQRCFTKADAGRGKPCKILKCRMCYGINRRRVQLCCLMILLKVNAAIGRGQWWRLLTPSLLHANLMHLVSNNCSLHNLGPTVEAFSGGPRFLAVYVISALTGEIASYRMSTAPSLGASGGEAASVRVCGARRTRALST